jgi:hypothetical protein
MLLQKIVNRVATSFGIQATNPAKNRTTPFFEQVTSVKNWSGGAAQDGSPLQKLAKRPAPQPTLAMKLNVALRQHEANQIADFARQIKALPDWKQQARALQEGPADRPPSSPPAERTESPNPSQVKRPAPQPTLAMKLNAALREREANQIADFARQIKALPDWGQQLQAMREGRADDRDATPVP